MNQKRRDCLCRHVLWWGGGCIRVCLCSVCPHPAPCRKSEQGTARVLGHMIYIIHVCSLPVWLPSPRRRPTFTGDWRKQEVSCVRAGHFSEESVIIVLCAADDARVRTPHRIHLFVSRVLPHSRPLRSVCQRPPLRQLRETFTVFVFLSKVLSHNCQGENDLRHFSSAVLFASRSSPRLCRRQGLWRRKHAQFNV